MATKAIDLGAVSAYAVAVKNGFVGTEAEWEQYIANASINASQAASASEAAAAAQAAAEASEARIAPAVAAGIQAVEDQQGTSVAAVQAEGATQVQAVRDAGAEQDAGLVAEGQNQIQAIQLAAETQEAESVAAVQAQETASVAAVNQAGATQVSAVETKGAETIASIPEDYTELTNEIMDVRSALRKSTGNEMVSGWKIGYYDSGSSATSIDPEVIHNGPTWRCVYLDCQEGDVFYYTGYGSSAARPWVFLLSDGTIQNKGSAGTYADQKVIVPANAAHIVFNAAAGDNAVYSVFSGQPLKEKVTENTENIADNAAEIGDLKSAMNVLTDDMAISISGASRGHWEINNDIATKVSASSGYYYAFNPIEVSEGQLYIVSINCNSGHAPIILANYSNDQYVVVDTRTVTAQRVPEEFEFVIPTGVTHMLLTRYGASNPGANVMLKIQKVDASLSVPGVPADAKATGDNILDLRDKINATTSYKELFNGNLEYGYIAGNGVYTPSTNGICYRCAITAGYVLRAIITAGTNNRLIIYGSVDNVHYTEIARNNTARTIDFNAGNYKYCCVLIFYGEGASQTTDDFTIQLLEAMTADSFDDFKVNGVSVITNSELGDVDSYTPKAMITNLNIQPESLTEYPKNLCFMAGKIIYEFGKEPTYTGYLFCDIATNKFYFAAKPEGEYQYLFTWDASLADGDRVSLWNATITADGDVIFLKYRYRRNPIIYPHTDYTQPYIVDFSDDKKPDGWLVNSSVVHFSDGTFVFGDYAAHKESDEANNDGRIIWRVTKPYNDPNNWSKVHTFKHVYFSHYYSDEPENEIGHIHAIMYDFYTDDLYCTTGDIDRHCRMWISRDHGATWSAIPGAVGTTENTIASAEGQKWRMTNSVFTKDAIWWGTDAQRPYHNLWKCTRDETGHIDFSTLTKVIDLETPNVPSEQSQRTYIVALMRGRSGLLILDRGEPRPDILDLKFYDFENQKLYIVASLERATNDASSLEGSDRLGIAMQATTIYQPFDVDGIITGGGTYVRPNCTSIFNNSQSDYVGALKIKII